MVLSGYAQTVSCKTLLLFCIALLSDFQHVNLCCNLVLMFLTTTDTVQLKI